MKKSCQQRLAVPCSKGGFFICFLIDGKNGQTYDRVNALNTRLIS